MGPHVIGFGFVSEALPGGGSVEYQNCELCRRRVHDIEFDRGIGPLATGECVGDDCPRNETGGRMAQKGKGAGTARKSRRADADAKSEARGKLPTRSPRKQDLPGMEDRAIKDLEECAAQYADIRDARIRLNQDESELKKRVRKLMHKYGKKTYKRGNVEIELTSPPVEEGVKVRIKKIADEDDVDIEVPESDVVATADDGSRLVQPEEEEREASDSTADYFDDRSQVAEGQ